MDFAVDDIPAKLESFLEQDLFAKKKLFILESLPAGYEFNNDILDELADSANLIVFSLDKIDKRVANNKVLLFYKKAEVKEFPLPHGSELDSWIINRVRILGGAINKTAAALLARRVGRDDAVEARFGGKIIDIKEVFDLWQVDSEIRKLLACSAGEEIDEPMVAALVPEREEADALRIVSAIADKNKQTALKDIGRFLGDGDEKAGIIQLNALLSEQFRNILALQDLLARRASDQEILTQTSWKSGRLFVLKKIAARFQPAVVKGTLNKLAALDQEVKSSSTPPRVLLDLILAQLFA